MINEIIDIVCVGCTIASTYIAVQFHKGVGRKVEEPVVDDSDDEDEEPSSPYRVKPIFDDEDEKDTDSCKSVCFQKVSSLRNEIKEKDILINQLKDELNTKASNVGLKNCPVCSHDGLTPYKCYSGCSNKKIHAHVLCKRCEASWTQNQI